MASMAERRLRCSIKKRDRLFVLLLLLVLSSSLSTCCCGSSSNNNNNNFIRRLEQEQEEEAWQNSYQIQEPHEQLLNETLQDIIEETGVNHNNNASWTYEVVPAQECEFFFTFCIPTTTFTDLPFYGQDLSTLTSDEWEDLENAIVEQIDQHHVFANGLPVAIARFMLSEGYDNWNVVEEYKFFGVTMEGPDIHVVMLSLGAVIRDISEIDYIGGTFTVDLRLYVKKIDYGQPYYSVKDAVDATWNGFDRSSLVVRHCESCNNSFSSVNWIKYLPDDYQDNPSALEADDKIIQDGSCSTAALKTARLLKFDEYVAMSGEESFLDTPITGGFSVLRGNKKPVPVTDANNYILYFNANGIKIKFEPFNSWFFPFQVNVLDINVASPQMSILANETLWQYGMCIDPSHTGLKNPLPSLPEEGIVKIVPTISRSSSSPWFNSGNQQMSIDGTGRQTGDGHVQEMFFQVGMFRLIYDGPNSQSWFALLPVLFTAFVIQLQWLTTTASSCDGSTMITAVLLIQNLVQSQAAYVGYKNIASNILTFTYVVAIIYVVAVALMTFINLSKSGGSRRILAQYQDSIFRYFRYFGNLMSFFYIPLLVFESDVDTGEQKQYDFLWPLVIAFDTLVLVFLISRDLLKLKTKVSEAAESEDTTPDYKHLKSRDIGTLSVEETKIWVSNNEFLFDAVQPNLNQEDLFGIAQLLFDADIDGGALLAIANDPKFLINSVGLSVGKAINFSSAIEELERMGSIRLVGPLRSSKRNDPTQTTTATTHSLYSGMSPGPITANSFDTSDSSSPTDLNAVEHA